MGTPHTLRLNLEAALEKSNWTSEKKALEEGGREKKASRLSLFSHFRCLRFRNLSSVVKYESVYGQPRVFSRPICHRRAVEINTTLNALNLGT